MTVPIAAVLLVLAVALVLFVSERLRMDLIALLVLATLAVSGLVTPAEALAGFSNPAVVTVWAMFVLSAGLTRTGVAELIGRRILSWVGRSEPQMIAVIMLTAGLLSAVMNNIGVAALLLPVVLSVAHRTGRAPSRLLMPLAFGSLLGGLTTLIGTPPNLLISDALRAEGLAPFRMFDFAPVGVAVLLAGTAFFALVGRHLLPARDPAEEASRPSARLPQQYRLEERSATLRLPAASRLAGKTLAESRLGSAAGLNVFAVVRGAATELAPAPGFVLRPGDQLLVEGRLDRFDELRAWRELVVEDADHGLDTLLAPEVGLAELTVAAGAELEGRTLGQAGFRGRFRAIVLALRRGDQVLTRDLGHETLRADDRLLVHARRADLDALLAAPDFAGSEPLSTAALHDVYRLPERLLVVRVPRDSSLVGRTLAESRVGDALGFGVLRLDRDDGALLLPGPEERLAADDRLLVRGQRGDLDAFLGLLELELEAQRAQALPALESAGAGLMEAMLAPRTTLAGRTLRELGFRERYGLQVLAFLREGEVLRSGLRDLPLRFGDVLLLLGPPEKRRLLASDPEFLVLTEVGEEEPATARAPLAAGIMLLVLAPVLLGWLPIAIAAVAGVVLMVLSRCLSMEEAYRAIEWRSVFLIAGMLPLGTALHATGAASWLAELLLETVGPLGPWGVLVCLYLTTAAATAIIPTAALVVLMAPIVLRASAEIGLSVHAAMMAVAMAASASFTSPISHPANVLVMGPGGYRFKDYVRVGVPLTLVVLAVVLLVLPLFWEIRA